jgi:O-antigen/teichoic acid export membrane protein
LQRLSGISDAEHKEIMQIVRKQITVLRNFLRKIPPHLWTASSSWGAKAINILVQIASIRTLLFYLGEDRYAVYIIAFSVTTWSALSNFSVGISLQNYISECRAKNQSSDKYLIATLQISLCLIIVFVIVAIFLSGFVQSVLFRKFVLIIPETQTLPIVFTIALISILQSSFSNVFFVYLANHKGFISNIVSALAAIASLSIMVLFNRYSVAKGSLISALLIFTLPQMLVALISFATVFKKYFLQILNTDWAFIKLIFTRAFKFHGTSILYTIASQIDYLIISQTLKSQDIIVYNTFLRFFMMPIFLFISFCAASWPRFREMYIQNEFVKIKAILRRYLFYAVILSAFCFLAILLCSPYVLKILMPQLSLKYSFALIILFGIYATLSCCVELWKTFLYSANMLRVLWICLFFQIIIGALAQFALSRQYGI